MASGRALFQVGLLILLVTAAALGQEEREEGASFGENCLAHFTAGMPDFMLDTDASVQNGATFLASPPLQRGKDCVRACCKHQACNLALVEQTPEGREDHIQACFLLDCLYEQSFVCKFARKVGFLNYFKKDVYDAYMDMREQGFGGKEIILDLYTLLIEHIAGCFYLNLSESSPPFLCKWGGCVFK